MYAHDAEMFFSKPSSRSYHQGYKREGRHDAVSRSSSNPSFYGNTSVDPQSMPSQHAIPPQLMPGGHYQHAHAQFQQQPPLTTTTFPGSVTSSDPPPVTSKSPPTTSTALWGEVDGGRPSVAMKQPMMPLWKEGWRPATLTCSVPRLYPPATPSLRPRVFSGDHTPTLSVTSTLDHPRTASGHNLVLHCVDLRQHITKLKSTVSDQSEIYPDMDPHIPPTPTQFWEPGKKTVPSDLLGPPKDRLPQVQLDQGMLYLLLRKSVAAISNHAGYEGSSSRALDTLADVLRDFLSKLCQLLRINTDLKGESGSCGFQDVLDQSLHQCGIEGKAALHKYWVTSVKKQAQRLQQTAIDCRGEHEQHKEPAEVPAEVPAERTGQGKDLTDLRFPTPWLAPAPVDPGSADEEFPLEMILQQANMDNVLPTSTPDIGGPVMFSQFPDSSHETEEFSLDGPPPRKRLRTESLTID